MPGWRLNKDAFNCLNNYFANIHDVKELGEALQSRYRQDVTAANRETFLRVLQYEFARKNELAGSIKEIAHQIIVDGVGTNPSIIAELRAFNKEDKELLKDTMRFKVNLKKS